MKIEEDIWSSVLVVAVLTIMTMVGPTDGEHGQRNRIACCYERRAHAHWEHLGEVGQEPAMQDCEDR